jgi:hypothetical protein
LRRFWNQIQWAMFQTDIEMMLVRIDDRRHLRQIWQDWNGLDSIPKFPTLRTWLEAARWHGELVRDWWLMKLIGGFSVVFRHVFLHSFRVNTRTFFLRQRLKTPHSTVGICFVRWCWNLAFQIAGRSKTVRTVKLYLHSVLRSSNCIGSRHPSRQ